MRLHQQIPPASQDYICARHLCWGQSFQFNIGGAELPPAAEQRRHEECMLPKMTFHLSRALPWKRSRAAPAHASIPKVAEREGSRQTPRVAEHQTKPQESWGPPSAMQQCTLLACTHRLGWGLKAPAFMGDFLTPLRASEHSVRGGDRLWWGQAENPGLQLCCGEGALRISQIKGWLSVRLRRADLAVTREHGGCTKGQKVQSMESPSLWKDINFSTLSPQVPGGDLLHSDSGPRSSDCPAVKLGSPCPRSRTSFTLSYHLG